MTKTYLYVVRCAVSEQPVRDGDLELVFEPVGRAQHARTHKVHRGVEFHQVVLQGRSREGDSPPRSHELDSYGDLEN